MSDFKFALRILLKSPGFTIAAILILALGIGTNTAVFSLVNTLLFSPPPYARPAEIVQVFSQDRKNPESFRPFSYPTYRDLRAQNTVFSGVLAYRLTMVGIGGKTDTHRTFAATVSSNYFSVLGVAPMQGRAFLPEEETPGRNAQVVVVSHNFWKKRAYDPALLGSAIQVNGRLFTVVGIMPEGFTGTMPVVSPEVWLPLGVHDLVANENRPTLTHRTNAQLLVVGRLRPGLTVAAAAPALASLAANLEKAFPVEQKDQTFLAAPLSRFSSGDTPDRSGDSVRALGPLLLGMAGVVLLVSCLNLASMLLARGTARRREIAIRLALGGSRVRIVRQLVTEGLVLALAGGAAGLLLALWSSDLIVASLGDLLPFDVVWSTSPNLPLLAATFGFCLLGTLVFAVGPALRLARGRMIHDLKEQAGEDVALRPGWKFLPRHPLVVLQVALSLALLTAAVLFVHGAVKAAHVDTGLRTDGDFIVELDSHFSGLTPAQAQPLYERLAARFAALPGVAGTGWSSYVPFGLGNNNRALQRAGLHPAADARPATAAEGRAFGAVFSSVSADYFRTVGLPLLQGRAFTAAETTGAGRPGIAIVDDVLARQLWPDGHALGQHIQYPASRNASGTAGPAAPVETFEIVGIVPATRGTLFEPAPKGAFYLPFARSFQSDVFFHVKFAALAPGGESAAAELLRRTVREVDPGLPVLSVRTFAQHLDANFQLWLVRAAAALFSVFGGLALGLAVVGVYGVEAYSVARRTREIGIRLALGAQPGSLRAMILREGVLMLLLGSALGLGLAVGAGRILSGLLYEVGALDPVAFTLAPVVLAAATLLACYLPARRATKVDPMIALRVE